MADIIDRYFIVKVQDGDDMVADSAATYDTEARALKRAKKIAKSGTFAAIYERVVSDRIVRSVAS